MTPSRLVVTELTPPGRGAVSVLELRGDLAIVDAPLPLWRAANGRPLARQPCGRISFGAWGEKSPEDVVVCRIAEDLAEVHCHGGRAAVERIKTDLIERGSVVASPEESLRSRVSPVDAECRLALARATTERTAKLLAEQASGVLRLALEELREALEHAAHGVSCDPARELLTRLLEQADFGRHLTEPWSVVLCGRPNVGKSSLANALAGFARTIVSDVPGTTRDLVTTQIVLDGWPLELSDSAGLRTSSDEIEAEGIRRMHAQLAHADLKLVLLDVSRPLTEDDHELTSAHPDAIVIGHKCDLPRVWSPADVDLQFVSSVSGEGLDRLMQEIVRRLVPRVPSPGTAVPVSLEMITQLKRVDAALSVGDCSGAVQLVERMSGPRTRSL